MKRKIALGMFIAACAYIFLIVIASIHGYPSGDEFKGLAENVKEGMKRHLATDALLQGRSTLSKADQGKLSVAHRVRHHK